MREPTSIDAALRARIEAVCEEGREHWHRFDADVRQKSFHPYVAADYQEVLDAILSLGAPSGRFLEWGSATGVITIMADLLGYDACGIEIDASLVEVARDLARRSGSNARFVAGSFLPTGWEWKPRDGDARPGTIDHGRSGYLELGHALSDFDVVYGYPWGGEEPLMLDLMREHGSRDAWLILQSTEHGPRKYRGGRVIL